MAGRYLKNHITVFAHIVSLVSMATLIVSVFQLSVIPHAPIRRSVIGEPLFPKRWNQNWPRAAQQDPTTCVASNECRLTDDVHTLTQGIRFIAKYAYEYACKLSHACKQVGVAMCGISSPTTLRDGTVFRVPCNYQSNCDGTKTGPEKTNKSSRPVSHPTNVWLQTMCTH